MLAQQLYEGIELGKEGTVGLITYMRTDSTRISDVAQGEAASYITAEFGEEYLKNEQRKEKNKRTHRMPMKRYDQQVSYVILLA